MSCAYLPRPARVIVAGFRVSGPLERLFVHYAVYLDEFGHIGPYVSSNDPKYNDSPVFGLAGMLLPVEEIREFAIWFYQLKCKLLAYDLKHANPGNRPAYQWEKKGSQVYTVVNVNKYKELRQATNRILNRITKAGGHVFYTGIHKTALPQDHNSSKVFSQQLLQTVRKIDQFCAAEKSTFMMLLDEQRAGDDWRMRNVEACTLAMFEDAVQKCRSLIEPPIQAESHLFQTLQCADWICGLVGRLTGYASAPAEYPDWDVFTKYFSDRITAAALPCSALEKELPKSVPATAETLLNNDEALVIDQTGISPHGDQ